MTTIGLELKICRIIADKLVKEVPSEAAISRPRLSLIENGHILPIPEVEARLRRIVGWTPAVHHSLLEVLGAPDDVHAPASAVQAAASQTIHRAADEADP